MIYLVVAVFTFERFNVRVSKKMFGQLMFQTKDLGAKWARVVAALVMRGRQMLFQAVPVVEHLATLVAHHLFFLGRRPFQGDAHVLDGHVDFKFG